MPGLKAAIVRIVDDAQPGWVECRFADARGLEHSIVEKIPVLTDREVTSAGPFPFPVTIECRLLEPAPGLPFGRTYTVDLAEPWGIHADTERSRFEVASEQLVPSVFVSCADIDAPGPRSLLVALRAAGCIVDHSPREPNSGRDPRWTDWYRSGLARALSRTDAFIAVIDEVWDSSTWMGEEAHQATEVRRVACSFFWNPRSLKVRAMQNYLRTPLPDDPVTAVERVIRQAFARES